MTNNPTGNSSSNDAGNEAASDASGDVGQISRGVIEAWEGRSVEEYVNAATRSLSAGSLIDWGLAGRPPKTDAPPISLRGGIPDADTQPREQLIAAARRVLEEPGDAALVYGGPQGFEPLREEIARFFAPNHPAQPDADWYFLTNGAAGAIEAVCSALIDPGDVVISEAPTFAGSLRTIRGKQAEVVGVGMDGDGIRLDRLEQALDRVEAEGRRVKLIYTQPTFQNPTGLTTGLQRRLELLELAARRGVFILEDHAYSELWFDGPPPPTLSELSHGHGVFTIGTFSKVIATGLRVGWVQARPEWLRTLLPTRFDMGNSPLLHRMIHEYMARGDFREHVERMRALYKRKAETLADALVDFGEPYFEITRPQGGFFLWLRLHAGLDADAIHDAATDQAVYFGPGDRFYPNGELGGDPQSIRIAYSWPPVGTLEEAAGRIERAFAEAAG